MGRLDVFLTDNFRREYTRSYWSNMIEHGFVTVNEQLMKAGYRLRAGDTVRVRWPTVTGEYASKVEVIYENSDVMIINKPAGMLTHSKGDFNPEYTVSDYAIEHGAKDTASLRAGIVHRLDRQTSGVMVIARTSQAALYLQKQFAHRTVQKYYLAMVEGRMTEEEIEIDIPISRNPHNPKTFAPAKDGKQAVTRMQCIRSLPKYSLVLAMPHTGRTHQIRVHLQHIGHPIIGDSAYGSTHSLEGGRFMLHAFALMLSLPDTSEKQTFFASLPDDMTSYIDETQVKKLTEYILHQAS